MGKETNVKDNWSHVLEKHGIQFVVLSRSQDKKLVKALRRQPGWSVDFKDQDTIIFARAAQKGRGQ